MIRAIAWDVDGTLVDSEPNHHRALMAVCARYGLAIAADDQRFVGVAMDAVWPVLQPQLPPGLDQAQWLAEIVEAYIAIAPELMPFKGAVAAVETLAAAGLAQCCVSNSASRIVQANLAAIGVDRHMVFAVAREDVADGKPAPDPYALACCRLGLPPATVLAVEDSAVGVASASAAGLAVLQYGQDFGDFAAVVEFAIAGASRQGWRLVER